MTTAEILKSYQLTCQSYGRRQTEGESEAWVNVLSDYSPADLDAALRRWHSDVAVEDFTQKPKGARMPSSAELKYSIEQFTQKAARTQSGWFIPCNNCEEGWVRVFHGRTAGGNQVDGKVGAVRRCSCFDEYLSAKTGVSK